MKIVEKWMLDLVTAPNDAPQDKPKRALILNTHVWEAGDPTWELIEETLRATDGDFWDENGKNWGKFCTLRYAKDPQDFIQIAYQGDEPGGAWHLERREWYPDGRWTHYYARMTTDEDDAKTIKNFDCILDAFMAFYRGEPLPAYLTWVSFTLPEWE